MVKKRHMDFRGTYKWAHTSDNCLEILIIFLNHEINGYKAHNHMQPQNKVPHSVLNKTKIFSHVTLHVFCILFKFFFFSMCLF